MSMIQRLQKLSIKIFQESLKTYELKDLIIHKKANPHNLIQLFSLYPNKGVGFYIWRKDWPEGTRIRVTEAAYKSNRFGKIRGIKVVNNQEVDEIPAKIRQIRQRGIWEYQVENAEPIELDNGMVYTNKDYLAYKAFRERSKNNQSIDE